MAGFMPQGFLPDPEHQTAATITPDNPHVSAAALADADKYAKPHTVADDNAPALEPGQKIPPTAAVPPAAPPAAAPVSPTQPFVPQGFKPDDPHADQKEEYINATAAQLTKAGLPQERAMDLAQKSAAKIDFSDPLAPMSTTRKVIGYGLSSAMGAAPGMAAAGIEQGVVQGGRFSMERLGNILAEDAENMANAAKNGVKVPPFQEWGRIAETLSENPRTVGALKVLWSDPKYKLVRWAILSALTGGTSGAGMARYMAHRALYDAVVH